MKRIGIVIACVALVLFATSCHYHTPQEIVSMFKYRYIYFVDCAELYNPDIYKFLP